MTESIHFTVNAMPKAQGSMSRNPRGGMRHSNPKLKAWRAEVAWAAKLAVREYVEPFARKHVPVRLTCDFYFERPKSVRESRIFPVVPPDTDKLLRACCDAGISILWQDDAQVVEITGRKFYGRPARCEITVRFAATEAAE